MWKFYICLLAKIIEASAAPRKTANDIPDHTFRDTGCRLLINEVNVFTDNPNTKQYIELSRYCDNVNKWSKSVDMKGFKLLFIAPDGYLIGMCSLANSRLIEREKIFFVTQGNKRTKQVRKHWTYVIGAGIENPDLHRDACQLLRAGMSLEIHRFPTGVNYPVGIALIYNEKPKVLESIQLNRIGDRYVRTEIDTKMQSKITKYLQDFYQYGSTTMYQYCRYFSLYYNYPEEVGTLLRDWFVHNQSDFGLSRCSGFETSKRTLPFQPQLFKYADPSPSEPNHCSDAFEFSIDSLLPYGNISNDVYLGSQTLPCVAVVDDPQNAFGIITSDLNYRRELAFAISERPNQEPMVNASGNSEASCNDLVEIVYVHADNEYANIADSENKTRKYNINVLNQDVFESNLEKDKPYIWTENSCERFPKNVVDEISGLDGSPLNTNDILQKDVCYWVNFIPETQKIVCKLCRALLIQNIIFERPSSVMITDIMTVGVMDQHHKNRWRNNRIKIQDHIDSIYHKVAVQWFSLYDSGLRSADLQDSFENKPGAFMDYIGSTRAMMAITKQAVEMGLSFYNFEKLTELLNYFNVDIGHLYGNGSGMKTIIESLSDSIHQEFVDYLLQERPRLSVLLDGTSDTSSETIVAILFMVESPKEGNFIKLYKILHLREGETGENVYNALRVKLEEDGLVEFFKTSLVSVTSDGGLNIYNVFNRHISNFIGRPVLKHWCDNHRENLLYKNTVNKYGELKNVAYVVNKAQRMYNSKSPKNKAYLRNSTIEQGGKPFEVKRTHEIRWVSGNLRAYKTFFLNWKYIAKATLDIQGNRDFSSKTKSTAHSLFRDLTDPIFLSHLGFLYDVGRVIGEMSLQVERRGATLIAKKEMRVQFLALLESLKSRPTESVESLIHDSIASGTNEHIHSLQEFETIPVTLRGIELSNFRGDNTGLFLYEKQNTYLDEFITQTKFYFPEDARDGFDIFDARKFPNFVNETHAYGNSEILTLNAELAWGFNSSVIVQDWKPFLKAIISHPKFNEMKQKTPETFWKFFMSPSSNVMITDTIRSMMANVLLVSASNAETERVLGIYTRTKTKQRYLLYPKTVESILRIKINGKKNLNHFNTMKYAKDFIMRGHSRANDISRRGKRLSPADWDELITENVESMDETDNCESMNDEEID